MICRAWCKIVPYLCKCPVWCFFNIFWKFVTFFGTPIAQEKNPRTFFSLKIKSSEKQKFVYILFLLNSKNFQITRSQKTRKIVIKNRNLLIYIYICVIFLHSTGSHCKKQNFQEKQQKMNKHCLSIPRQNLYIYPQCFVLLGLISMAQFIRFWFWSWCGSNRRKRRIIPISLMCFPDSKTRTKAQLRCIVCQQHVSCHIPWARFCQKWQKVRFYAFPQLDGLPCRQWVWWSGGLGFVLIK